MKSFNLNAQIAYLRKKNNLSQEQFAQLVGVTNQAVSKWETGVCCPDIQLLPVIADCFGVSIDALFLSDDYESRSKLMTRYECTHRDEDFMAAVGAYEKVILSCDATMDDRRDYAYLYDHRAKEYTRKAEKLYESAIAFGEGNHDESYYRTHIQWIIFQCRGGRGEECLSRYASRLREEPGNWWNHYLLALCYMEESKPEDARQITEAALSRFGGNEFLYTMAGDLCEKLGRYDEAFAYWESAYDKDTRYCSCLYSAAACLERLGRKQEAIEAWRRVVKWHHEHNWHDDHETDMPLEHIEKLAADK